MSRGGPVVGRGASRGGPRTARGFTLVEVTLALAIFGLLIVTAYSAFFIGHRAVVAGERDAATSQRLRVVSELLGRQIRSAVYYFARDDDDTVPFFAGGPSGVTFVTAAPQSRGGTGLAVVTYQVADGRLILEERVGFSPDDLYAPPTDARVEHAVLLSGFDAIRFEYLPHDDPEFQWQPTWDAREEDTLPAAVRISVDGVPFSSTGLWMHQAPLMTISYGYGSDEFRDADDELDDEIAEEEEELADEEQDPNDDFGDSS